ncbi:MAG: DUF3078 domain-containing protein [Muribaculaceae bacterium]|nr:DUF3078 domain-containing protein [Muribaculaceae bacterium]
MKKFAFALLSVICAISASAAPQARYFDTAVVTEADTVSQFNPADTITVDPLPGDFFMPLVFNHYEFYDPVEITVPDISAETVFRRTGNDNPLKNAHMPDWLRRANNTARLAKHINYKILYGSPQLVHYNMATLPEAPKMYYTVVDPSTLRFDIRQFEADLIADAEIREVNLRKRHWINTFSASLQFSQAYVSPNWYQGGNNNLTAIAQFNWDVKLNPKYHPNLLFETHAQYKLGTNSAPDDSLHAYNISEDLFQINSTFGLKAAKRWYYSLTAQFKTQLLNSYESNSHTTRASLLSPGELNIGLGMTYNYLSGKGKFSFDASISPLSYNLRTCIDNKVNAAAYDIPEGRHTKSKFGSSGECKLKWKITYNISFASRIFAFTDYDRFEADWENTLLFEINRFLTTQIYAHLRYDSSTQPCADPQWHKLQVKEILSIGFAYKFSNV